MASKLCLESIPSCPAPLLMFSERQVLFPPPKRIPEDAESTITDDWFREANQKANGVGCGREFMPNLQRRRRNGEPAFGRILNVDNPRHNAGTRRLQPLDRL